MRLLFKILVRYIYLIQIIKTRIYGINSGATYKCVYGYEQAGTATLWRPKNMSLFPLCLKVRVWGCLKLLTTTGLQVWLLGSFDFKVAQTGSSTPPWQIVRAPSFERESLTLGVAAFRIFDLGWVPCLNNKNAHDLISQGTEAINCLLYNVREVFCCLFPPFVLRYKSGQKN